MSRSHFFIMSDRFLREHTIEEFLLFHVSDICIKKTKQIWDLIAGMVDINMMEKVT